MDADRNILKTDRISKMAAEDTKAVGNASRKAVAGILAGKLGGVFGWSGPGRAADGQTSACRI